MQFNHERIPCTTEIYRKGSFALGRLWGLTILRAKFSLILYLSLLPNLLNLAEIMNLTFFLKELIHIHLLYPKLSLLT